MWYAKVKGKWLEKASLCSFLRLTAGLITSRLLRFHCRTPVKTWVSKKLGKGEIWRTHFHCRNSPLGRAQTTLQKAERDDACNLAGIITNIHGLWSPTISCCRRGRACKHPLVWLPAISIPIGCLLSEKVSWMSHTRLYWINFQPIWMNTDMEWFCLFKWLQMLF